MTVVSSRKCPWNDSPSTELVLWALSPPLMYTAHGISYHQLQVVLNNDQVLALSSPSLGCFHFALLWSTINSLVRFTYLKCQVFYFLIKTEPDITFVMFILHSCTSMNHNSFMFADCYCISMQLLPVGWFYNAYTHIPTYIYTHRDDFQLFCVHCKIIGE